MSDTSWGTSTNQRTVLVISPEDPILSALSEPPFRPSSLPVWISEPLRPDFRGFRNNTLEWRCLVESLEIWHQAHSKA